MIIWVVRTCIKMPKKNPINGFSLYMKELLQELNSKRSRDFYTLADMSEIASPKWQSLPAHIKANYNEKAKAMKNQKGAAPGKLTSDGIPIQHILAAEEEASRRIKQMMATVRKLVSDCESIEEVSKTTFYVISFNILIATQDGLYLPIEVGLVEYNIHDGLKNSFHKFINPGPIPVGYTSDAKSHSETTHEIPVLGCDFLDDDHSNILAKIIDFINGRKQKQIIFSHGDQLEQNERCFEWLKHKANYCGPDNFYFADLSMLLIELRNISNPLPAKVSADDMLKHNGFDYAINTRCEYHEDLDNPYCALGYSRKLCFILSDALVESFQVEVTPQHMPERLDKYTCNVWEPSGVLRPVNNIVDVRPKPIVEHKTTTIVKNVRSSTFDYEDAPVVKSSVMNNTPAPPVVLKVPEIDEFPLLSPQIPVPIMNNDANATVWSQRKAQMANRKPLSDPQVKSLGGLGIGRGRGRKPD